MGDWELQVEELLALQAIYGSDQLRVYIHHNGASSTSEIPAEQLQTAEPNIRHPVDCVAHIEVEIPNQILYLQSAAPSNRENKAELRQAVKVEYLPPLVVVFSLPADYPTLSMPQARISSVWLNSQQAVSLQEKLKELWKSQGAGAPILFTWIDWMKSTALTHLGADKYLVLGFPAAGGRLPQHTCEDTHHLSYDATTTTTSSNTESSTITPSTTASTSSATTRYDVDSSNNTASTSADGSTSSNCEQPSVIGVSGDCVGFSCSGSDCSSKCDEAAEEKLCVHGTTGGGGGTGDDGGGGAVSAFEVMIQCVEYSERKKNEQFEAAVWTCTICFATLPAPAAA